MRCHTAECNAGSMNRNRNNAGAYVTIRGCYVGLGVLVTNVELCSTAHSCIHPLNMVRVISGPGYAPAQKVVQIQH